MLGRRTLPMLSKLGQRQMSSNAPGFGAIPKSLYNNVWKKSNIMYITYIVVGCVAIEVVYGSVTQSIWDNANKGKLYKQIDWTQFKSEDDEDEDEDEDDDE
jgi:hypothetical protein